MVVGVASNPQWRGLMALEIKVDGYCSACGYDCGSYPAVSLSCTVHNRFLEELEVGDNLQLLVCRGQCGKDPHAWLRPRPEDPWSETPVEDLGRVHGRHFSPEWREELLWLGAV
jgi:hypothetical protein